MRHDQRLVRCIDDFCDQTGKRKVITLTHLGQGVYQALDPVCGACGSVMRIEQERNEPSMPEVSGVSESIVN